MDTTVIEDQPNNLLVGFLFSLLGHGLLFYSILFLVSPKWRDFGEPVIYSVTLEGGKNIGGISQLPKDDKKEAPAPPKNVSAPEEQKPVKEEPKKEVKPKEEPKQEKEKAEVSVAEKKKEEPKPKEQPKKKEEPKKEVKKQPTAADINKQYQQAMQRYVGESTDAGGKGFGAAKLGGTGMGGGVLRPPEFFQYRDLLKSTIKKGWRWFDENATLVAWLTFSIAPDGAISNVEIASSSGNSLYDESAVRAVLRASPLPAPPESVYEFFKEVRIEFTPRD